MPNTIGIYPWT